MTKWLLIFLTAVQSAAGQQLLEGRVVDKETGKPVPFASIGVVGTAKGTSSNLNGQFSISIAEPFTLKITCIGYETALVNSPEALRSIELRPTVTQLKEVFVFQRAVNPKKIVRKAFANISANYDGDAFLQNYFYRHYCKDDSIYGRLIEASVDVWKHYGYRAKQKVAGDKEEIRVTQLRRSLDKSILAQGHEPIAVKNILQADLVAYQRNVPSPQVNFYSDVNNLTADFENYLFEFIGITQYDGQEVYEIRYQHKKDSVLTTTGYRPAAVVKGSLFITTDTHAFLKTEEVKELDQNIVKTSAYYRKYADRYYPYHLIREGENKTSDRTAHWFRIELMSVEVKHGASNKFTGQEPGKNELLKITYDSLFWNSNTILKTTPLEDDIIRDLGGGASLNEQFYRYQQYEYSVTSGSEHAEEKFNWLRNFNANKKSLYIVFWSSANMISYLRDLELAKQFNKKYRSVATFVFIAVEPDETKWKQILERFTLFSDGIVHYRVNENATLLQTFRVKSIPSFVFINRSGLAIDYSAKHPSDPLVEELFRN